MRRLEVRLLPARQLVGYLRHDFGAVDHGDGTVTGEGWIARFIEGEPVHAGSTAIPVLFIEIEGEREREAAEFLAKMTMRGGG